MDDQEVQSGSAAKLEELRVEDRRTNVGISSKKMSFTSSVTWMTRH